MSPHQRRLMPSSLAICCLIPIYNQWISEKPLWIMLLESSPELDRRFLKPNSFRKNAMHNLLLSLTLLLTLTLSGCGYNTLQSTDEQIKAGWSEVLNQYQRRADLVPNLVNVVKGFAAQEKDVLLGVTNARSKVGSIQATPELINNPEAFARFQSAQGELSGALSRLLVVAENYPQLKSDANFRELQAQLEGTENRITVARNRYIKAVQEYNVVVRSFPSNLTAMVFGFQVKPGFTVENEKEISSAPKVDFSTPSPAK
ncbi:LemA protein [Nitrosospira sp. Nsp5]|uniref:LemA protein n=2 Tax=Nitrosomonadaceae TaxID=206379 RepID=A0ABY0TKC7_9PROT|nr:LemA protein [Nitrosospira sp. Nsp5]SDQ97037.1 LemA protein [Nitrosospira multiformis]